MERPLTSSIRSTKSATRHAVERTLAELASLRERLETALADARDSAQARASAVYDAVLVDNDVASALRNSPTAQAAAKGTAELTSALISRAADALGAADAADALADSLQNAKAKAKRAARNRADDARALKSRTVSDLRRRARELRAAAEDAVAEAWEQLQLATKYRLDQLLEAAPFLLDAWNGAKSLKEWIAAQDIVQSAAALAVEQARAAGRAVRDSGPVQKASRRANLIGEDLAAAKEEIFGASGQSSTSVRRSSAKSSSRRRRSSARHRHSYSSSEYSPPPAPSRESKRRARDDEYVFDEEDEAFLARMDNAYGDADLDDAFLGSYVQDPRRR